MEAWENRVLIERVELARKVIDLANFISSVKFDVLDAYSKSLLVDQAKYMQQYLDVLDKRCALIKS